MAELHELSAQEIGRRLRIARESANIRQEIAAKTIDASRATLISVEQGVRRVRIQELQKLAHLYGTSVNAILRRESVHTDLVPRFRRLKETEDIHTIEAVKRFSELIKADVELENVLGIVRRKNYPPEHGIADGDVVAQAEARAQVLRKFLQIGPGPIVDIFVVIEQALGIRLYQSPLSSNSKVAGLFSYDDASGACIFLNVNHPLHRRIHSAAHELGHFDGTRQNPEVLEEDERFLSRDERYANAFGRAFLMPIGCFAESFSRLKQETRILNRRLIIKLANEYNVSRQACCLRLEEIGQIKKGSWDWFVDNGGITDQHEIEVLGQAPDRLDPAKVEAKRPLSYRLSAMAYAAWKRELMSEGQLSELLNLDRLTLREILEEMSLEDCESNDILKLAE